LHPNGALDRGNVGRSQTAELATQPLPADRCDLIRHGLPALPIKGDVRFCRIEAIDAARKRDDLKTVKGRIGSVVADDDGGPGFADFPA
jgi:hypothetical protein